MKQKEIINSDETFRHMDETAYDVIATFTRTTELANPKPQPDDGVKINM